MDEAKGELENDCGIFVSGNCPLERFEKELLREQCRCYAKKKGWNLRGVVYEVRRSSNTPMIDRPGIQMILCDSTEQRFDILAVSRLEMITGNRVELFNFMDLMLQNRTDIFETSTNRFLLGIVPNEED